MSKNVKTSERDLAANVGAEIRKAREATNLSTVALSKQAGYSDGYVSQVERGHMLAPLPALIRFGEVLGVDYIEFLPPQKKAQSLVKR